MPFRVPSGALLALVFGSTFHALKYSKNPAEQVSNVRPIIQLNIKIVKLKASLLQTHKDRVR